tara:strand:+ start:1861 stop:2175 length:315 start_codon:yes stop_codon:yes gene_type:complete
MKELTLKPRLKKSGSTLKAVWYCKEYCCDLGSEEVLDHIRQGIKFDFDFSYDGKYKDLFNPEKLLLNFAIQLERSKPERSVEFNNRIIRNGGLINYIKKLETNR